MGDQRSTKVPLEIKNKREIIAVDRARERSNEEISVVRTIAIGEADLEEAYPTYDGPPISRTR